jgi:hypothetical protein
VERPSPSTSPHGHMILRVDLVGSTYLLTPGPHAKLQVAVEELTRFLHKIVPDVTAGQLKRFVEHVDPMRSGHLPCQTLVDGMKHADPKRSVTRAPTYLQVCAPCLHPPPLRTPGGAATNKRAAVHYALLSHHLFSHHFLAYPLLSTV